MEVLPGFRGSDREGGGIGCPLRAMLYGWAIMAYYMLTIALLVCLILLMYVLLYLSILYIRVQMSCPWAVRRSGSDSQLFATYHGCP